MSDLFEKLQSEIQTVSFDALAPHAARGALFVVAPDLELVTVAAKIVQDDTAAVSGWVAAGRLYRPSQDMLRQWQESEAELFSFVIVQPYVLCQRPQS